MTTRGSVPVHRRRVVDAGHEISEERVWRLCSQARIVSAHARKAAGPRSPARRCTTTRSVTIVLALHWTGLTPAKV